MSRHGPGRLVGSLFLVELVNAMMFVALPLLMVERYGLGVRTGAVLALALAPQLLLAGLVRAAIRRSDARDVAIASALVGAVAVACFPLTGSVLEAGVLAFATGSAFVFGVPARMALRSRVMLAGSEVRGNSLIVGGERLAMTLGPVLGAALVSLAGVGAPFYFEGAALVAAATILLGIAEIEALDPAAFDAAPARADSWAQRLLIGPIRELRETLRGEPLVAALTVTAFGYVTAVGASRLLLASRAKTLFGTTSSLGLLVAAMAAGGVAGAILGGRIGQLPRGRLYIAGNLCEAMCWPAVALVQSKAVVLAVMFVAGVCESIPTVLYFAEVQIRLSPLAVGSYYALLTSATQICAMLGVLGGSAVLALGGAFPLSLAMACLIAVPVLARAPALARSGGGEPGEERYARERAA
jgi:predicted MFS family arabinose efflux permease